MGEKRNGRRIFEPETIECRGGRLFFRVPDQLVCQHRIKPWSSRVLLFLHSRKSLTVLFHGQCYHNYIPEKHAQRLRMIYRQAMQHENKALRTNSNG